MSITRSILIEDDKKNIYLAHTEGKLKCIAAKGNEEEAAKKIADALFGMGTPYRAQCTDDEVFYQSYLNEKRAFQAKIKDVLEDKGKYLKHVNTKVYRVSEDQATIEEKKDGIQQSKSTAKRLSLIDKKNDIKKIIVVSEKELKKGLKKKHTKYNGIELSRSTFKLLKTVYKK